MIYFNKYKETIKLLDELLESFPENEKDINLLKAVVLRRMQNIGAGLEIIESLIEKYPKDNDLLSYKAYWYQFLNRKEDAIRLIKDLVKKVPDNGTYQDTYGEILINYEEYDKALEQFLKTIEAAGEEWYINQTYIKIGICYKMLEKYDLALINLKKGKEYTNKSTFDNETKERCLIIVDLFTAEIEQLL